MLIFTNKGTMSINISMARMQKAIWLGNQSGDYYSW